MLDEDLEYVIASLSIIFEEYICVKYNSFLSYCNCNAKKKIT